MKKILSLAAAVTLMAAIPAVAQEPAALSKADMIAYYDSLSVEELLETRMQLNQVLYGKGYCVYYALTRGDKGDDVLRLQTKLSELGYFTGSLNGKYDTETQKAMKKFEKANGLTNDGDASAEDQYVLFSLTAAPEESEDALPETETAKAENPQKQKLAALDEKYPDYEEVDYGELARNPENFIGKKAKLTGKIVQVLGSRSEGFQIRLATSGSQDVIYVFINQDPGYNLLENDRLVVYGYLLDTVTYETTLHTKVTIPSAMAEEIALR